MVPFYLIPLAAPGKLAIMPAPATRQDVRALKAHGVDCVVSLLAQDEAERLGLGDERALCEAAGMAFLHYPIRDFGVPDRASYEALVADIIARVDAGQFVAVHCRAGIGRSGMVGVCVSARYCGSVELAQDVVSAARGLTVGETGGQRAMMAEIGAKFIPPA